MKKKIISLSFLTALLLVSGTIANPLGHYEDDEDTKEFLEEDMNVEEPETHYTIFESDFQWESASRVDSPFWERREDASRVSGYSDLQGPIQGITVHHAGGTYGWAEDPADGVNQVHKNNDWPGAAYDFIIGLDGTIYHGGPLESLGWHAGDYRNVDNLAICFEGNFNEYEPEEIQYDAGGHLIAYLADIYSITDDRTEEPIDLDIVDFGDVTPHDDWGVQGCPGEYFSRDSLEYYYEQYSDDESAEFVLNDWSIHPNSVNPGETVTVEGWVENIGDGSGEVSTDIYVDGDFEGSTDPNPYLEPGESEWVSFEVSRDELGTYEVDLHAFEMVGGEPEYPADDTWSSEFEVVDEDDLAEFELTGWSVDPEEVGPGETVTIKGNIENIGDEEDTVYGQLWIDDDWQDSESAGILEPGESTNVTFHHSEEDLGTYDVEVRAVCEDLETVYDTWNSEFEVIEETDFDLDDWSVNPKTVEPGENVSIQGEVENTGSVEESVYIQFLVEGEWQETKTVWMLEPGERESLSFTHSEEEIGTYEIEIRAVCEDEINIYSQWSSSFDVEEDTDPPAPPEDLEVEHHGSDTDLSSRSKEEQTMGTYSDIQNDNCCGDDPNCYFRFDHEENEDISPDPVKVGETVTISGEVQHHNGQDHSQAAVSLWIDGEEVDSHITGSLGWSETESFSFERTKDSTGIYDVELYVFYYDDGTVGGWHQSWSSSFEVVEESEPEFELSDWSVSPSSVEPDETVTIEGDITNVGDETGDVSAELHVDGGYEDSDWKTLEPGETETFTHTHSESETGDYEVDILAWCELKDEADDTWSGEFEVVEETHVEVETVDSADITADSATLEGELIDFSDSDSPHNRITWSSSPDDPDEVSHYNIYRSEDENGPWEEPIGSVEGEGAEEYEFIDEDAAGEPFYWYVVRSVGTNDIEEENTDSVQEPSVRVFFRYREIGENTWKETEQEMVISEGSFYQEIIDLRSDTEYEFKAVSQWEGEEDVGEVLTFTTDTGEAEFVLNEWSIEPQSAEPGEDVAAEGYVENIGDSGSEVSVDIYVEGNFEDSSQPNPYLEPDGNERISFDISREEEGYYDVDIHAFEMEDDEPITPADDSWYSEFEIDQTEYDLEIMVEGDGDTDPEPGVHTYEEGTEVKIEALPDEGWEFDDWVVEEKEHVSYGFWPYWIDPEEYDPDWSELSHVSAFSMTAESDGSLYEGDMHHYDDIKDAAESTDTEVTITVAQFDQDIQDEILAYHRQDLVDNIVKALDDYDADGVNIDIEHVRDTNSITGESNVELMEDLLERLYEDVKTEDQDHHISFCTAGSVEEVYRNSRLSDHTDHVFLMGYDYHWSGADTTGPVSPYDKDGDYTGFDITDSMDILRDYYPGEQLVLGVPFYGYEWPAESDEPGAETEGEGESVLMTDAVDQADQYGRNWHEDSNTPWYAYEEDGQWYQGWYDDEESLELKWEYVRDEDFAGTGFWALGYETPETWDTLGEVFSTDETFEDEEGTITIIMDDDKKVTAHFEPIEVVDVEITPSEDQVIEAGEEITFEASAYDPDDDLITDDRTDFEWENATRGVFNRRRAGDYQVTAVYDGVTSTATTVTVEPAEADRIEIGPEEDTIEAGMNITYTATAYDEYENEIGDVSGETSWSIEDGAGGSWTENEYTSEVVGDWTVTGDHDGSTDTALLTVEPGEVDTVELTPSEDQTIVSGEKLEFSAEAYDAYGNLIADNVEAFEWENAARGVFYHETSGEYEVTATYDDITSETTTVTVEEEKTESMIINKELERPSKRNKDLLEREGEKKDLPASCIDSFLLPSTR